jgi:HEAT repeat protein
MTKRALTRTIAAVAALIVPVNGATGIGLNAQESTFSDSTRAVQLLANARGANPVMCELAMQSVDRRYGNWGSAGRAPDAIIGQRALLEWASQDIEDAGVVGALSGALSDEDVCVRRMAARLFGRVEHPSALQALTMQLENPGERTRQMAAVALGYLDNPEAVEDLITVLNDRVAAVRAAATWALGEIEDERALSALTRMLENDPDPFVRRQAAWALGNIY